jgi:hypothetical protein
MNDSHKYSDYCGCVDCSRVWNNALLAAIDRSENRAKKKKKTTKTIKRKR